MSEEKQRRACEVWGSGRLMCVGSIGDSDDELGRFLGVLRFWFTKDLVGLRTDPAVEVVIADSALEIYQRPALQSTTDPDCDCLNEALTIS